MECSLIWIIKVKHLLHSLYNSSEIYKDINYSYYYDWYANFKTDEL